jgi:hypothetical protein
MFKPDVCPFPILHLTMYNVFHHVWKLRLHGRQVNQGGHVVFLISFEQAWRVSYIHSLVVLEGISPDESLRHACFVISFEQAWRVSYIHSLVVLEGISPDESLRHACFVRKFSGGVGSSCYFLTGMVTSAGFISL